MKKLIVVLGVSTLLFAASTAYFAWQLNIERKRITSIAPQTTALPPSNSAVRPTEFAAAPHDPPRTSAPASQAEVQAKFKGPPRFDAKGYLRMLENPESRADAVKAAKGTVRWENPGLGEYLGLSADESEGLMDLLAEQTVARRVSRLQCETTKGCDFRNGDPHDIARNQELESLLGTDKYGRYQIYEETIGERREVNLLRTQLPAAHAMSDEQVEQLVAALAEERARLTREGSQQGVGYGGVGTSFGMLYHSGVNVTAAQQIDAVTKYSARLRERAGQILTSRQSAVFKQNQDDGLAEARARLLELEVAASQGN